MDDRPPARRARQGGGTPLVYEQPSLLPPRQSTRVADSMSAASDMLAAATGLAQALTVMPGPLWAILNDRHAMEGHTPLTPTGNCVPCQFDRLLEAAHRHDPRAGQFRDPGDLFALPDDVFPRRAQIAAGVEGEDPTPTPTSIALVTEENHAVYEHRSLFEPEPRGSS
jgi:hypothetical protein